MSISKKDKKTQKKRKMDLNSSDEEQMEVDQIGAGKKKAISKANKFSRHRLQTLKKDLRRFKKQGMKKDARRAERQIAEMKG